MSKEMVFKDFRATPRPKLMRILWPFLATYKATDERDGVTWTVYLKQWRGVWWIFRAETSGPL